MKAALCNIWLLQETIKQCKKEGGDLSDEEEPKPLQYVVLISDQIKQLPYNSTKVDLVLLSLYVTYDINNR